VRPGFFTNPQNTPTAIWRLFLAVAACPVGGRGRPFFSLLAESAILLAVAAGVGFAPTLLAQRDRRVEQKIHEVENRLMPAVVLKGQQTPPMNILDRMHHYEVPGVSLAVINDYAIDWAKGYGFMDKESNRPVDVTTLFQAGSISKPVAAVAAMYFVEHGLLNLDQDVNQQLKSWKVPENKFTKEQKVTVRGLLSHSAGLNVHGFPGYAAGEAVPDLSQVLDGEKPANTPPIRVKYVPGTGVRYSGGGYTVLQLLLTDSVGTSFPKLMREIVQSMIGMVESTYEQPLPPSSQRLAARGYSNGNPIPGRWYTYPEMAAAGLWTSPLSLRSSLSRYRNLSRENPIVCCPRRQLCRC
jgi:CubicO group peptidase (beta-lactamase class C family)